VQAIDEDGARDGAGLTDADLPDDVRKFLRDGIESYEEMEIALHLRRRRDTAQSADEIAAQIHTTEEVTGAALARLRDAGVIVLVGEGRSAAFRYSPRSEELGATLDRLAAAYDGRRLELMKLMAANAIERVRSAAARTFADSFLWGRRRTDG
jgi:DNA-binding transcriptional ArsR family regulator